MLSTCRGCLLSQKTDDRKGQAAPAGYTYWVSDDQLAHYAALSILERLTWLDQARQFVLLAETEQTAARRSRLCNERAGLASLRDA